MSIAAALTGEINQYGLPGWIGGWVDPGSAAPIEIRAALDGRQVGQATLAVATEPTARITFTITFDEALDPGVVAAGRLSFTARTGAVDEHPLPVWDVLCGVDAIAGALATITRWQGTVGSDFGSILDTLPRMFPGRIAPLPAFARPAPVPVPKSGAGASPVFLPVGLTTPAGNAILGSKGYAFPLRGPHALRDRYRLSSDDPDLQARAADWSSRIAQRIAGAASRGIAFVQTVVPERSSIVPELLPPPLAVVGPTPLLVAIDARLKADAPVHYVSSLDLLRGHAERLQMVRRMDSGLTPRGSDLVARDLVRQAGFVPPPEEDFRMVSLVRGDLTEGFFDVGLIDTMREAPAGPRPEKLDEAVPHPELPEFRHQVWRHPGAPIDRRVVVFGDGMADFADVGQGHLSYWLARWFSAFHFVWTASCDWNYVDAVKPDVVICQTRESALDILPPQ